MRAVFFSVALMLLVASSGASFGQQGVGKIVGGQTAALDDWPWMAALIFADRADAFDGQFCGAVIVHPRWAVTAAQCVQGRGVESFQVGVGSNSLDTVERVAVKDIVIHPDFDRTTLDNDIALLLLESPVSVPSIRIVEEPAVAQAGTLATILGWGSLDVTGTSFPRLLQEAQLPIVENAVANAPGIHNGELTGNMLAAGFAEGGVDVCFADSGGPLVVPTAGGWALAGLTSFGVSGVDCAAPEAYGGYTRVANYRTWINAIVRPHYAAWASLRGASGRFSDDDGDGRGGLLEYSAANDPQSALDDQWPRPELLQIEGETLRSLSFLRRVDTGSLSYTVEYSTDLQLWTALDPVLFELSVDPVPFRAEIERVSVRAPGVAGNPDELGPYLRLSVSDTAVVEPFNREITVPGYSKSSLSPVDRIDARGHYYKDYQVRFSVGGNSGASHVISVRTSVFDAVVQLINAVDDSVIASAGPSAGVTDLIVFEPEAGIDYVIRVSTGGVGEQGAFVLAIYQPEPELPIVGSDTIQADLATTDSTDPNETGTFYVDDYLLSISETRQLVFVGESSSAFDSFLQIVDLETGIVIAENDDVGQGNSNSGLNFFAEAHANYIIRAGAFFPGAVGDYELRVSKLRVLAPPEVVAGSLEESDPIDIVGAFVDPFFLPLVPTGAQVTVTLTSSEFDPYLNLFRADSENTFLDEDDNSGGGTTARLQFVADGQSGYYIDATSALAGESGSYSLQIEVNLID